MCGIVAAFAYGANASPLRKEDIICIRDAMFRRGPDAAGYWNSDDERVALGHRRLSIIDLSPRGIQPMAVAETGTQITYNGEIYNYRELRHDLEQRGYRFQSDSDTEVLLHAYDADGPQMVHRLRGMYAFAIWDARRNGMFLARDPFGIKPLYYSDDGKRIIIASQVKALTATGQVSGVPSSAGQVSFLLWGFIVEPHTIYRDIRALPAGSMMWIDGEGARPPAKYWSVADVFRDAEAKRAAMSVKALEPNAVAETLRHLLGESINYHMVADVPVGVFLSGGLDSAAIVGLASDLGHKNLRTMTLGFDELQGTVDDEVPYAEQIASIYHTQHNTHLVGIDEFGRERTRVMEAMDQPSVDGVNVYFVSFAAAAAGLKVALSGLGGDELFGGYPSFKQIPRLVNLLAPFSAAPLFGRAFRRVSTPMLRHLTSPKYASLFEYGTNIEDAYLLRRGLFLPWELPQILDPEVVKEGWEEIAQQARLRECTDDLHHAHEKIASLEMTFYMRNQLLRDSDWAGMAHSLEIRVPFVDATLLREISPLIVGSAPLQKLQMTRVLRDPLPASILNRPKTGFTPPIRDWIMKDELVDPTNNERGLRGWAKFVLKEYLETSKTRATTSRTI